MDGGRTGAPSRSFPWQAQCHPGLLEGLPDRLIVTAVALGQALTGPALPVQPDCFVQTIRWDALPPQLDSSSGEVADHRRPVQAPAGRQHRHVVAGLVLADKSINLLSRQATLPLPRLRWLGRQAAAEQGR